MSVAVHKSASEVAAIPCELRKPEPPGPASQIIGTGPQCLVAAPHYLGPEAIELASRGKRARVGNSPLQKTGLFALDQIMLLLVR
jgi:hypothetical protein